MTQEQKAKAYDKVREKIAIRFGSNVADEIFSQFEMSEDERIRKELVFYLGDMPEDTELRNGVTNRDILAWLETQGTSYTKRDVDDAYLKGISDAKNEFEKQYEANYQIRKDIATFILNYRGDIKDRAKWMNYLGIKVSLVKKQGEQKPITSLDMEPEVLDKVVNDCIFGNEKSAWSEEDEENMNNVLYILNQLKDTSSYDNIAEKTINCLKSLKDRYTWKPSDELLDIFIKNATDFFESNFNPLTDGGVIGVFDDKEKMIEEFKEYMKEEGFNEEWI